MSPGGGSALGGKIAKCKSQNYFCFWYFLLRFYPELQKVTAVKPWMNVYQKIRRVYSNATGVNPWFGVYFLIFALPILHFPSPEANPPLWWNLCCNLGWSLRRTICLSACGTHRQAIRHSQNAA